MSPATRDECGNQREVRSGLKGWPLGVLRASVPWLFLLAQIGCSTPKIVTTTVAGLEIVEHLDDKLPSGCEQAFPTGGCYQLQDGKHSIWYSRVSLPFVREHEIAHALGMRHTVPWVAQGNQSCATVTVAAAGYTEGQRICVDAQGEHWEGGEKYASPEYKNFRLEIARAQSAPREEASRAQALKQTEEQSAVAMRPTEQTKPLPDAHVAVDAEAQALETAQADTGAKPSVLTALQGTFARIRNALAAAVAFMKNAEAPATNVDSAQRLEIAHAPGRPPVE